MDPVTFTILSPKEPEDGRQILSEGKLPDLGEIDFSLILPPPNGVLSARAIVYRKDEPWKIILRQGENGGYGFVGGKVDPGETPLDSVAREIREETGLKKVKCPRQLSILNMPEVRAWYSIEKSKELGIDIESCKVKGGKALVANPLTLIYACSFDGDLKHKRVEGRKVIELNLRDKGSLKKIRPAHRELARAWRDYVLQHEDLPEVLPGNLMDGIQLARPPMLVEVASASSHVAAAPESGGQSKPACSAQDMRKEAACASETSTPEPADPLRPAMPREDAPEVASSLRTEECGTWYERLWRWARESRR